MSRSMMWKVIVYIFLTLLSLFAVFPFLWMLLTSLKPIAEIFEFPPRFMPRTLSLGHYQEILQDPSWPRYFLNSLIISMSTTIISVTLGAMGSYSLARFNFPGSRSILISLIASRFMGAVVLVVSLYLLLTKFNSIDTYQGLIFTYLVRTLPLSVWLLTTYFQNIPWELEESARIDGCSRLGALVRIIFPIIIPGVIAIALYCFILSWQNYIFAVSFTSSEAMRPVSVGVAMLFGEHNISWGKVMAASILAATPAVAIFVIFRNFFIGGLIGEGAKM